MVLKILESGLKTGGEWQSQSMIRSSFVQRCGNLVYGWYADTERRQEEPAPRGISLESVTRTKENIRPVYK
jgi:hypothetical protein